MTLPAAGRALTILGIETSCDETAAAVVCRTGPAAGVIRSNTVRSQLEQHRPFGGVVPEIAARAHLEVLDLLVAKALEEAGLGLGEVDGIAATNGPGLIGGLLVGQLTGKAIAFARDLPFIAVNHLEAHALTPGLTDGLAPPYLLLLVSGGHTQILMVHELGRYRRLASTIDDALGEAFDKTAKMLGLGYPGGPEVERRAHDGDPARFPLPRPMRGRPEPHFSFAGLKTAVRRTISLHSAAAMNAVATPQALSEQFIADLCASFEAAVTDCVVDRIAAALAVAAADPSFPARPPLVVAGGVAANRRLRSALLAFAAAHGLRLVVPPVALCTDNAAMIAWTGAERLARGLTDPLDTPVRVRWPLDPSAPPALGAGRLGAKA